MCGSTQTKESTTSTTTPSPTIPAWVTAITPDLVKFYKSALSDREYPASINTKTLQAAINTLGATAFDSVMQMVKEPADLFYVPHADYMEKMWQGIIDYGQNFTADKMRSKFSEYEGTLKQNYTALSKGKGYAVDEMQAMFRDELKPINSKYQNDLSRINALAGSDTRFRKSNLIDIEIAKNTNVQDARDTVMAKQAEMRLQSEFQGNAGLLELATKATDVEMNAEKMEMAGKGIAAEGLKGLEGLGKTEMEMVSANQATKQQNISNLMGLMTTGQNMWEYDKNYALSAATGANQFVGSGLNYAAATAPTTTTGTQTVSQPSNVWSNLFSGGLSAGATALGMYLGSGTNGGGGGDKDALSLYNSLYDDLKM